MRAERIALALLACAVLAGCETFPLQGEPPPPEPPDIAFRRVVLVEFANRSRYSGTGGAFTRLLRDELAGLVVSSDFVVVERKELVPGDAPLTSGRISLKSLVRARDKYLADAVIVGSIDDHNPYWRPSVQVSLKVINTATAGLDYELAQRWDAATRGFQREVNSYYKRNCTPDEYNFGSELFAISQHYFLKFVAHSLARRLVADI